MPPAIVLATFQQMDAVRSLFREYAAAAGICFCFQDLEAELAHLPGPYAPPEGIILLALHKQQAIGCVALKPLTQETAEMKRLYVQPAYRGSGLGRQLAQQVMLEARQRGYRSIKLDTLQRMASALAMYRSLGFENTAPYCHNPELDVVYLERSLT